MVNEIRIQGKILESAPASTNGFYIVRISNRRFAEKKISIFSEDEFLLAIPQDLCTSPNKDLANGNLIKVKGNLQNVKSDLKGVPTVLVFIVVESLVVESYRQQQTPNAKKRDQPDPKGKQSEKIIKNQIECICGNTYPDTLELCPICHRTPLESTMEKKNDKR
jgi:hypothetical protein